MIGGHFTQWPLFPCWGKDDDAVLPPNELFLPNSFVCQVAKVKQVAHVLKAYGPGADPIKETFS